MLSRRWPRPKWIKYVTAQIGFAHPSGWNVTLYLQLKRSLFFTLWAIFPFKVFFGPIRPKRDYKMVNESSKRQSAPIPRERRSSRVAFGPEQKTRRPTNQGRISTQPQPLKNDLHPLSSWPVIWGKKKAHISPDIPIFIIQNKRD